MLKTPQSLGNIADASNPVYSLRQEDGFFGLDVASEDYKIPSGFVQRADNCFLVGALVAPNRGIRRKGRYRTRPGFRGELSAANLFTAPAYGLLAYTDTDRSSKLLLSAAGKLYKKTKGATDKTEIKTAANASLAFKNSLDPAHPAGSETFYAARAGKYAYCIDGVGSLVRTDLSTGDVVTLMSKPSSTGFAAGLDADALSTLTSPGSLTWTQDYFDSVLSGSTPLNFAPSATATVNADPMTDYASPIVAHAWLKNGDISTITKGGKPAVWYDESGEGETSKAIVPPTLHVATAKHAKTFEISLTTWDGDDPDGQNPLRVTVTAYSDAGATSAIGVPIVFQTTGSIANKQWKWLADFTGQFGAPGQGTDVASIKVDLAVVDGVKFNGVSVQNLYIKVAERKLTLQLAGDGKSLTVLPGTLQYFSGQLLTAGAFFEYNFGSDQNWRTYQRLVMPFTVDSNVANTLQIQAYLRTNSGTVGTGEFTNNLEIAQDGTAFVDFSNLSDATRSAVRYIGFRIVNNLNISDVAKPLFTIGPVKSPGNLSIGADTYDYILVEVDGSGDATVLLDTLKSDGSNPTGALSPTRLTAVGVVTLPARTNSSATYWQLFRRGGTFRDGLYRLVAMEAFTQTTFAYGADTAKGSGVPAYAAVANPFVAYTAPTGGAGAVGGNFRDNTPDSWIRANEQLYDVGRNAPPTAAQAICGDGNRLALGVGSVLYLSWLLSAGNNNGLYFTYANTTSDVDPSAPIKGWTTPVGAKDNDVIQSIVYYAGRWYIFKSRSIWVLTGSGPDDFRLRQITSTSNRGLIAPRAITIFNGYIWYLSDVGLRIFDGDTDAPASSDIDPYLFPALRGGGLPLAAAAMQQCWLMTGGDRLYFGAPSASSDTYPTVCYLWDARTGTWASRWTGINMTGAVGLTGVSDTGELYFTSQGGQVYAVKYDGATYGDKADPSASTIAVTMTLQSRGYGQETPDGTEDPSANIPLWSQHEPQDVRGFFVAGEAATLTTTVTGDVSGAAQAQTYALASGTNYTWQRFNQGARGHSVSVTFAASVTNPLDIRGFALGLVETENRV